MMNNVRLLHGCYPALVIVFGLFFMSCMPGYESIGEIDLVFIGNGDVSSEFLEANGVSGALYESSDSYVRMTLSSITLYPSEPSLPEVKIDLYDMTIKFDDLTKWDPGSLIVPVGRYDKMQLDIASISVGIMLAGGNDTSDENRPERALSLEIAPGLMPTVNLNNFVVAEDTILEGDMIIQVEAGAFTNDAGDWYVKPSIVVSTVPVPRIDGGH